MRSWPLFITLCVLINSVATFTAAQQAFQVIMPTTFPVAPQGAVFTSRTALAVTDGSAIHVLDGLPIPANTTFQTVTPTGSQAMSTPWTALTEEVAAYCSTAGELILVRDLPANPTLVSTGIFGSPCGFVPVNETTAVSLDVSGGQLVILRHDASGASLHTVPSPITLTPGFQWGPSQGQRVLAIGGALQRDLAVFEGLDGAPSGFQASTVPVQPFGASGNPLDGFFVTESGTGIGWEHLTPSSKELSLIRFFGGPPQITRFVVDAGPLTNPGFPIAPQPAHGDNILFSWNEDVYQEHLLLIGADDYPQVARTWCSGEPLCSPALSVAEDELLLMPFTAPFVTHEVYSGPHSGVTNLPFYAAAGPLATTALKANPETLVTLTDGTFGHTLMVYEQLNGNVVAHPFLHDVDTVHPEILTLGAGLVGILCEDTAVQQKSLVVISLPTVARVGTLNPWNDLELMAEATHPLIGAPFSLTMWPNFLFYGSTYVPPMLAVSLGLGDPQPLPPPFSHTSTLDLDPTRLLGLLPSQPYGVNAPLPPGIRSFDLGFESLPPELVGLALYFQAIQYDNGGFYLSNTLMLIPG